MRGGIKFENCRFEESNAEKLTGGSSSRSTGCAPAEVWRVNRREEGGRSVVWIARCDSVMIRPVAGSSAVGPSSSLAQGERSIRTRSAIALVPLTQADTGIDVRSESALVTPRLIRKAVAGHSHLMSRTDWLSSSDVP